MRDNRRMPQELAHLDEPVEKHVRTDFTALRQDFSIREALEEIRRRGTSEDVIYFYVVDEQQRLSGILHTRRLLMSPLEQRLSDVMSRSVIAIPQTATVLDACELFVLHKYLAFPVVDEQRRIIGIVDVNLFTQEVFDLAVRDETDDVFETLGFRVSQVREASPWRALKFRLPWLLCTVASGTVCALLASAYEQTLAKVILLAFFLTLVLALGEAVSVQSMSVAIQALHATRPTLKWFGTALRREMSSAVLLGGSCGSIVAVIVYLWRGTSLAPLVIGGSVFVSFCGACFFGLAVPTVLHRLRLDPKIAAGPVALALTDVFTLLFYFNFGGLLV
jgi:magnesium transporter